MKIKANFLSVLATGAILFSCASAGDKTASSDNEILQPIQLFNVNDINDWTPKIRLNAVGENYVHTLDVEDAVLKVRYDGYDELNKQYEHLAYNTPYSYYFLRVEYRFVDEQVKRGEGWA